MTTSYMGSDTHTATEREELARAKLYDHIKELRACILDLLTLVSASTDPVGATAGIAWSRTQELQNTIREIERHDHIIRRARAFMAASGDAAKYTGPQNA